MAAGVLALALLAGCTSTQRSPSSYSGAEDDFIEGCVERATADNKADDSQTEISSPKTYCTCVFDALSDPKTGVKFSTFKEINTDLQSNGGPLPKGFQKAYADCEPGAS